MASKGFEFDGVTFVINNVSAILSKDTVDSDFYIIQYFLRMSEMGFALTNPDKVYSRKVFQILRTSVYHAGNASRSPSITSTNSDVEYTITPTVVCQALGIPV